MCIRDRISTIKQKVLVTYANSFPIAYGMSIESYGDGMEMLPHTIPIYGSSMDNGVI